VSWRVNLMLTAAKLLGFDQIVAADGTPIDGLVEFWSHLDSLRQPDPWFELAPPEAITACTTDLNAFLVEHPPAAYASPSGDLLKKLLGMVKDHIPPVGFQIDAAGEPELETVDFRHVLYAGWVAAKTLSTADFADINRLCEHAIMQQRAIEIIKDQ